MFLDTNCDGDIDECASSPCNDGVCTDQVDGYYCTCEPGFTGTYCETNINECESAPCQNGATCVDGRNAYVCDCVPGYTGKIDTQPLKNSNTLAFLLFLKKVVMSPVYPATQLQT